MKNKVSSGGDLMFKVSEATLPKAMDYVYENFIKPHDPEGLLAYRPTGSQSGLRHREITLIKKRESSLLCQAVYIQHNHHYIQTLCNLCGQI